jgi:hypothetical protein
MSELLDIAALAIVITLIFVMLISLFALVDMWFDSCMRIDRAILLLVVAGLCIYGINSITGY